MQPRLLLALLLLTTTLSEAQRSDSEIGAVAARAGIIFRGTVLAVAMEAPRAPGEVAAARVTFRVEDGIRGATTGQVLTIRQWNATPDEYRVGEALVLFLYAPSDELGLTSPVGGRAGHRRVDEVPRDVLDSLRNASLQRPARKARP